MRNLADDADVVDDRIAAFDGIMHRFDVVHRAGHQPAALRLFDLRFAAPPHQQYRVVLKLE